MQYGKNYGPETLFTEYKEFTFHHSGVDFDLNTAEELVINSKWCFNDMIYEAIIGSEIEVLKRLSRRDLESLVNGIQNLQPVKSLYGTQLEVSMFTLLIFCNFIYVTLYRRLHRLCSQQCIVHKVLQEPGRPHWLNLWRQQLNVGLSV
jgi:hypothetical protein